MIIEFPEIFQNPELIETRDPRGLCADGLSAWAICMMGGKTTIPENFGEVLVSLSYKIGMKNSPTAENLTAFAREKGWLPK